MLCAAPGCTADAQCDRCLAHVVYCLRGAAQERGRRWAESVAERRPELRGRPWPVDERARAMAAARVADITSDPRVAELLVDEVLRGAVRAWERPAK